uniref:Major facilitator superfamily multidrug transporter NAG4 (N-acetylglucosamine utilization protein 4) (Transmembrane protein 2) n=1 Tax=Ganoderma boninense TaxID=34458 RepID=A0A5K1JYI0_9APHY|nr:Major facilitator superfamily multidrug transporter NAG4 (N-acetylglucosamine utilization protein 4) (Transmembrane protein 2) [Ganoderma boninense]
MPARKAPIDASSACFCRLLLSVHGNVVSPTWASLPSQYARILAPRWTTARRGRLCVPHCASTPQNDIRQFSSRPYALQPQASQPSHPAPSRLNRPHATMDGPSMAYSLTTHHVPFPRSPALCSSIQADGKACGAQASDQQQQSPHLAARSASPSLRPELSSSKSRSPAGVVPSP